MEDRNLTEKESLDLITQMIRETQTNTARHAAYPLLIWGYLTSIISIVIWMGIFVFNTGYGIMNLWLALPLIAGPLTFYFIKKDAIKTPKNYMERITGQVWMVFGIVGVLIGLASFFQPTNLTFNVLFIISIMMSMATTLSGLISKYKPLIACGAVSILLSFVLLYVKTINSLLIFAAIFVVMMVIPGHIFNEKQKKIC